MIARAPLIALLLLPIPADPPIDLFQVRGRFNAGELPSKLTALKAENFTDANLQSLSKSRTARTLTWLDLSELMPGSGRLTDASLDALTEFEQLSALNLDGQDKLSAAGLAGLVELEQLTRLELGGPGVNDEVVQSIVQLPQLRTLYLSAATEGSELTAAALSSLKGCASLRELMLYVEHLAAEDFLVLGELTELTKLDLSFCGTPGDAVLPGLAALEKLEVLDISGLGVTDRGVAKMTRLPVLRSLTLSYSSVGDASIATLLESQPELERLELNETTITDAGLQRLAEFASLRELALYGCPQVTAKGLESLVKMPLESLVLTATELLDDTIMKTLAKSKTLRKLDLDFNEQLEPKALARLGKLSTLQELDLSWCAGVDDGVVKALSKLKGLRKLSLAGCESVSSKSIASLSRMKKLQSLDLVACKGLSSKDLAKLDRKLSKCRILHD